jgi:hypothetical protein
MGVLGTVFVTPPPVLDTPPTAIAQQIAQIDISGEWGSRLHEDLGYRGPGPALGEYVGLPLHDAGRQ